VSELFGAKYTMIRAGARIAWRYALLAEVAQLITTHYKFKHSSFSDVLKSHAQHWTPLGSDVSMRLRKRLREIALHLDASGLISEMAGLLNVNGLQDACIL